MDSGTDCTSSCKLKIVYCTAHKQKSISPEMLFCLLSILFMFLKKPGCGAGFYCCRPLQHYQCWWYFFSFENHQGCGACQPIGRYPDNTFFIPVIFKCRNLLFTDKYKCCTNHMKRNGYRYYKKTMVKKPQAISNFRFVVQCPASLSLHPTNIYYGKSYTTFLHLRISCCTNDARPGR